MNEDCYVAFLDILGFKEIVNKKDVEYVKSIFHEISKLRKFVLKSEIEEVDDYEIMKKETIIRIMSDSIIIAVPSRHVNSFAFVCMVCMQVQASLLKYNILIRGGIERGHFYCNKEVMFGVGLTNAYLLENIAKSPRIIVNPATAFEYRSKVGDSTVIYAQDFLTHSEDMYYYINYLPLYVYEGSLKVLRKHIIDNILKNDIKVRDKYIWMANYFNEFVIEYYGDEKLKIKFDIETLEKF